MCPSQTREPAARAATAPGQRDSKTIIHCDKIGAVEYQAAARAALTAPRGPVSLEVPIDVQREKVVRPGHVGIGPITPQAADPAAIDALAELVRHARRPMLWLGGGAHDAGDVAVDLAERGFAIVSSTNGRAVVPETHRHTLGAYNMTPPAQAISS